MEVIWACGHRGECQPDKQKPVCGVCGSTRVRSTNAKAPRFNGTVTGPHATRSDLPAMPVQLGSEA